MRRRLYFVLPDVNSARLIMNELLLARIGNQRIYFYAQDKNGLGDLPRASTAEKTDMLYGSGVGTALGAIWALLAAMLAVTVLPWYIPAYQGTILLMTTLTGAIAGAGLTAMVAAALPSSKIEEFKPQLARGQALMMVLAPLHRVGQVRELIHDRYPQAGYGRHLARGS